MFCKNCGKEISNGSTFCDSCGTKIESNSNVSLNQINANDFQSKMANSNDSIVQVKKKYPTKLVIGAIIAAILIIIIAIAASGGDDSETKTSNSSGQKSEQLSDDDIEQQIYNILNSTPAVDGYNTSVGIALDTIFSNYDVSINQWGGDTSYNVKISGTYCPNPEVPQYTDSGDITYLVDVEKGYCKVRNDVYGIEDVIKVYVANYLG